MVLDHIVEVEDVVVTSVFPVEVGDKVDETMSVSFVVLDSPFEVGVVVTSVLPVEVGDIADEPLSVSFVVLDNPVEDVVIFDAVVVGLNVVVV